MKEFRVFADGREVISSLSRVDKNRAES